MRRASKRQRTGARVALAVAVILAVAACGDDDDGSVDPVAAAEARVSAAQESVTGAQASLDEATGAFCDDTRQYVTAVDRYGDVFEDTAATVGDVETAGADLRAPREAVVSSAESAVDARDELAQAEQDLADAEAALAEAQSGTPAPETTTTTAAPLVPAATVDRVEAAEADLAAAAEGITAQTPLIEAGAQYNAAAFAVEVSWLRLFDDAGCLTDEQRSQALAAVAEYTTALQAALQTTGYYDGPVDGVYGPATAEAVEALQTEHGLPMTGYLDQATAAALDAELVGLGGEVATEAVAHTAAVQSTLKLAGYWIGPVDGVWTAELTEAVTAFQTALGVAATGVVDAATLHALEQTIGEAQDAAESSTTTTASAAEAPTTTTTTAATAP